MDGLKMDFSYEHNYDHWSGNIRIIKFIVNIPNWKKIYHLKLALH